MEGGGKVWAPGKDVLGSAEAWVQVSRLVMLLQQPFVLSPLERVQRSTHMGCTLLFPHQRAFWLNRATYVAMIEGTPRLEVRHYMLLTAEFVKVQGID